VVGEANAKRYVLAILLFAVLFYAPKFFEFRWREESFVSQHSINCTHLKEDAIEMGMAAKNAPAFRVDDDGAPVFFDGELASPAQLARACEVTCLRALREGR